MVKRRGSGLVALGALVAAVVASLACGNIREADGTPSSPDPDAGGDDGGGSSSGDRADSGSSGTSGSTTTSSGGVVPKTWAEAQAALAALRAPGPMTAQGSRGFCAPSTFVWRDQDGTMHAWGAATKAKTDYGFTSSYRPFVAPSDSFVVVDAPPNQIAVYATGAASTLVKKLPYAYAYAATADGVAVVEQGGTVQSPTTSVRAWTAATDQYAPVTGAPFASGQPPSSFAYDKLVVAGGVNVPYALWIVDVAKKTTASVVFDGALTLYGTKPSPAGLLVSYARSGPVPALRLYRDDQDIAAKRFELGDEVASLPALFTDSPATEHKFLTHVEYWNGKVLFDSAFGIWAYDLATAKLSAVQLGPGKTTFVPDVFCVMEKAGLLAYRINGDALGQVWMVPLASVPY